MSDRVPDPTRLETGEGDPSTVDAPVRWQGAAPVVPPEPRKSRWRFRRAAPEVDDREAIPAVDPWEGQDTPWDPMPLPPLEAPPPTMVEPPVPPPAAPAPAPQTVNRVPVAPRRPLPPKYVPQYLQERPLPPPPPRPKRRFRKGRLLVLALVVGVGVPAYFWWPPARQYPATAILPASVADLDRRDDRASRRATERLVAELGDAAFAGVYGDGNGKRVTIFGATGLRLSPESDLEAQIAQLTPDYGLENVESFDLGEAGAHERCGVGKAGRNTVVVCAWADHGSLVTVLMTRRSVADSAQLTAVLRDAVLHRG
jgi:hypothetical protein